MDERQRMIGVYDDVESLGQSQGDFDMYFALTIQPEQLGNLSEHSPDKPA